jgi:5-methyltetrahydropteroyltriglutamate--homocysteine methyltransferase
MKTSVERILTTHVGSLPRTAAVTTGVFARERGESIDEKALELTLRSAVHDVVRRQSQVGIDLVSDGELSKISYATYIKDRITGFSGDSPRRTPRDLEDYPQFAKAAAAMGGTPNYSRPSCVSEVRPKTLAPLRVDLDNFTAAINAARAAHADHPVEGFMNAASPGVIALFQPNEFYPNHEAYLEALGEAMRPEYEAIVAAGHILQLDCPDLGLGRHMMFKDKTDAEYLRLASLHVEVLNYALRNVAPDRVRMHICWGNYEGPHHHDVSLEQILPIVLRAKPQGLLVESCNPRHAHEWAVFRDNRIPDEKILIPGVIDSVTNFIEHPLLVAERIERFAQIVGRERVIAGTDCGFATFAGFGKVDEDIVYAKLTALADGARIASKRLWRKSAA